jgi:Chaperone of endosialidase
MKKSKPSILRVLGIVGVLLGALSAMAQGTAFTYQGQLQNNGAPANGAFNLAFTLYATNTGGVAVAGPVTNNAVGVSNGLFTAAVDFGPGPWSGETNWLEIAVAPNGADNFTTLAPRQQLTPTPYAIYAENVSAAGLKGAIADSQLPTNAALLNASQTFSGQNNFSGYVGIGTTNPQAPLEVVGNNLFPHLDIAAGSNAPYGAFLGLDATAILGGKDYFIFSTGGTAGEGQGKLVFKNQTTGNYPLVADSSGNVGIGTTSPQAALHVNTTSSAMARFQSSAADADLYLENTSSGGNQWLLLSAGGGNQYAAGGLIFVTANTFNLPPLVLAPNGYVGIDGTAPSNPLQVLNAYCDGNNWVNASDRALKENFEPITPREVLDEVVALPIAEWNYKRDHEARHIGPVAQDFHATFGLNGADDKHISSVDEGGVALAAIQGLNQKVEDLKQELERRNAENADLKKRLATIEELVGAQYSK